MHPLPALTYLSTVRHAADRQAAGGPGIPKAAGGGNAQADLPNHSEPKTDSMIPDKPITKDTPFKICFVCLGNICRSPTAEGVFQHLVKEEGLHSWFEIDSAGTSAYHEGQTANSKSQQTANSHGITLHSRARRFERADLEYFDLILAMDKENLSNIRSLDARSEFGHKVFLMREFDPDPGDREVPDPYYGGLDGFENVYRVVLRSCEELLQRLRSRIDGQAAS